ncbi:uncharacterized protein FSUBG_3935 [Fusarium subglutinans]|uniref:Clr5 domain-containing protein n=1 Tax=Gibberella subglutinans TaxID=42677 RepID=A0A8H5Q5E1_GIBSU|nr:uncharacterized protein FSUBG_3935 [Fusarium subglutinans]KAF5609461.1 hypothetical protein FSUBG_3935 [Fusarium subglutinans]
MMLKTTLLAAKPPSDPPSPPNKPNTPLHHGEAEWTAVYPIIERLYMKDRRKLRHIMQIMEEKHNFKASNAKTACKKKTPTPQITAETQNWPNATPCQSQSLILSPSPDPLETSSLEFLTSIHDWSNAFYESLYTDGLNLQSNHSSPRTGKINRYDPEGLSFAFRTIVELIQRGKGILAGRLTRKAFLDIENMLQIEAPLFIWNVLEIMYHMVRLGQTQLLGMLLMQLVELASNIHEMTHPIIKMLRSLQKAVYLWEKHATLDKMQLLEEAWVLNADIICRNYDSRLLVMYYRLVWESSCVQLGEDQLDGLDKWFSAIKSKIPHEDSYFQQAVLFTDPNSKEDTEPPRDYEITKALCVSAIQHRCTMTFGESNMASLVRLGLLKSRVLDEIDENPSDETPQSHTRFQARVMAYLMKVLMDVDRELGLDVNVADRMRNKIALREFGYSSTSPQVIHDMWQLEAFLQQEGHVAEAAKIRKETYKRLEEYVNQVPVDEV